MKQAWHVSAQCCCPSHGHTHVGTLPGSELAHETWAVSAIRMNCIQESCSYLLISALDNPLFCTYIVLMFLPLFFCIFKSHLNNVLFVYREMPRAPLELNTSNATSRCSDV